jgi:hypothetical protein
VREGFDDDIVTVTRQLETDEQRDGRDPADRDPEGPGFQGLGGEK